VLQVPGRQVRGGGGLRHSQCGRQPYQGLRRAWGICQLVWQPAWAEPGCRAILHGQGRIANSLAGVQVLFNGTPSPLLYASQVNALVPYGIAGNASASVQVTTGSGNSAAVSL
jgi:hypothetical protein